MISGEATDLAANIPVELHMGSAFPITRAMVWGNVVWGNGARCGKQDCSRSLIPATGAMLLGFPCQFLGG